MKEAQRGSNGVLTGRRGERKKTLSKGGTSALREAKKRVRCGLWLFELFLVLLSIVEHSQEWLCHLDGLVSEFCRCAVENESWNEGGFCAPRLRPPSPKF
jgi:hypothetical protein